MREIAYVVVAFVVILALCLFAPRQLSVAYSDGQQAFQSGVSDAANPYVRYPHEAREWLRGYIDAKNRKAEQP